jgi:hypothetical protein
MPTVLPDTPCDWHGPAVEVVTHFDFVSWHPIEPWQRARGIARQTPRG